MTRTLLAMLTMLAIASIISAIEMDKDISALDDRGREIKIRLLPASDKKSFMVAVLADPYTYEEMRKGAKCCVKELVATTAIVTVFYEMETTIGEKVTKLLISEESTAPIINGAWGGTRKNFPMGNVQFVRVKFLREVVPDLEFGREGKQ